MLILVFVVKAWIDIQSKRFKKWNFTSSMSETISRVRLGNGSFNLIYWLLVVQNSEAVGKDSNMYEFMI
jgi:hypothetical protein